jgi:hypothetical protein
MLFEHRVEQAQMLVAALQHHVDHFRTGFLQQQFCLLQPEVLLLLPDGHAEVIPEYPAEVTVVVRVNGAQRIEFSSSAFDFSQNVGCLGGPDERSGSHCMT